MSHPLPGASGQPYAPAQGIALDLTTTGSGAGLVRLMLRLEIDGYVVPVTWGETMFPLVPGWHRVHVHVIAPYQPRWAACDYDVFVPPGKFVPLRYLASGFLSRGRLGPDLPRRSHNIGCLWLVVVALLLPVIVLMLLLVLLIAL